MSEPLSAEELEVRHSNVTISDVVLLQLSVESLMGSQREDTMSKHERWGSLCHFCEESWPCETVTLRDENAKRREQADALATALRNQGLLQNTFHGTVWHIHDCPASFDFSECHYRCRVAREAFALAGTEPYVSQETRRDTEVYE